MPMKEKQLRRCGGQTYHISKVYPNCMKCIQWNAPISLYFICRKNYFYVIKSCLAESLILLLKHWLHISYQWNIHLEQMYNEEVLHSHIRRQNIPDEFKPTNFKVYIIDLV